MRYLRIITATSILLAAGAAGSAWHFGVVGLPAAVASAAASPAATAASQVEPPAVAVEIAPVGQGDVYETLSSLGTLRAQSSVALSSQTGGIVRSIPFRDGAAVDASAPVVLLDSSIAQAQFDAAQAKFKSAQARLGRSQELTTAGFRSKQAFEDDRTALDSASSDLAVRRANLDLLTVRAPFKGVLGQRMVGIGQYIEPGKTVVWLEDRSVLRINFHVPERYFSRLSVGQGFKAEVDAQPGKVFAGEIALIDTRPDLDTRDIELRGEIQNDPARLTSGLFARVELMLDHRSNATIVPPAAVQYTLTGAYVYKLDGERVRKAPVKVGVQMPDRVEILGGVSPGDQVVTVGQFNLDDGHRVTVVNRPGQPS